jgi:hypothetical protein
MAATYPRVLIHSAVGDITGQDFPLEETPENSQQPFRLRNLAKFPVSRSPAFDTQPSVAHPSQLGLQNDRVG